MKPNVLMAVIVCLTFIDISICQQANGAAVRLRTNAWEMPGIDVTIDGEAHFFQIDTSSSRTIFDSTLREKLGAFKQRLPVRYFDVTSEVSFYIASPKHLIHLGDWAPDLDIIGCSDLSSRNRDAGRAVQGILGMDIFALSVVRIDFDECVVAFLSSASNESDEALECQFSPDGVPYVFGFYTGFAPSAFRVCTARLFTSIAAPGTMASPGSDRAPVDFTSNERAKMEADARNVIRYTDGGTLVVGPFRRPLSQAYVWTNSMLGMDFLARFVVTFDVANRKLYLKPGRRFAATNHWTSGGLFAIYRTRDPVVIHRVDDWSAGKAAGVEVGDVLLSIDGLVGYEAVRRLNCIVAAGGQKSHPLRLERSGRELVVKLDINDDDLIRGTRKPGPPAGGSKLPAGEPDR